MKKVFIYAYTKENLGDDLFVKVLCERYPHVQFKIVCDYRVHRAFNGIENLRVYRTTSKIDSFFSKIGLNIGYNNYLTNRISKSCDAIVNIGGSLFMQRDGWEKQLKNFKNKVIKGKNFYLIGCNFGPYYSQSYLNEYGKVFSELTDVCFRDNSSFELFSHLSNVRLASDVVFSLSVNKQSKNEDYVCISVIDCNMKENLKKYTEDYETKIVETIRFIADKGIKIKLLSFCAHEGDLNAINRIHNKLTNTSRNMTDVIDYRGNLKEVIEVINHSGGIIATRFHAMILGFICNKPTYPLVYSIKTINVLKDINYKGKFTQIEEINNLDIKNIYEQISKNETINVNKQIKNSHDQFRELDKLLN